MLRNLCKRYIEQETNNADYGDKKKATKAATKIVKGNCKLKNKKSKKMAKKKKNKKSSKTALVIGGLAILGIGAYVWSKRKTTAEKKTELITFARNTEVPNEEFVGVLNQMTDAEINSTYSFIFKYFAPNKTLTEGTKLWKEIDAISTKYNVFT